MTEALGVLVANMERALEDESSRQASLLAEASTWFERTRQFRETEMEVMVLRDPEATEKRLHRACLAQMIAQGESLVVRTMLHGLPQNKHGITLHSLQAELDSLWLKQSQWHSEMTEVRKKELFQEVFGDQKSEA
jgi:hypothetical protein